MSRRAAAAAPPSAISSPPPPAPSSPFSETRDDEAAGDAPILCALSIHAIGAREAAPWRSTMAGIYCSDEGAWFPLCALLARDDAEGTMGDRAAATLLSARNKVSAACISDFARGSGIGLDFGRLGEEGRLRGAALSLSLPYVPPPTLDCAPRAAWACRHGAQPLAARDKAMLVFAGSACDAPLGVVPRGPAPAAFPFCKRTGKAAWQIPANRGHVLGIGAPCRTGSAAAFSPFTMVSAAARPYSTWGAPRRATAASYPCVRGGAVSGREMSTYTLDGSASSLGGGWTHARRTWGPYSGRSFLGVSVGSVGGSLLLLGLGYHLRKLFQKENKINEENRELRSKIADREKYIEELKARCVQTKFAPAP